MAEAKKDTSLNKRRQIDRSGRVMFGWVAGASVLVGFALVIVVQTELLPHTLFPAIC